jgi:hypothetical protein
MRCCGNNMAESDRPQMAVKYGACWVTRATDTHSEHVLLLFHGNSEYTNVPACYVTSTLPLLFKLRTQSRIARVLQLKYLRATQVQ